ncbi:MAG: hypothetical protein ABI763_10505 [Bacteroidota bacterium]
MNSTWVKLAIAYTAGMITFAVIEDVKIMDKLDKMPGISETDTTKGEPPALEDDCACQNEERYNVDPSEASENTPIDKIPVCQAMVAGAAATTPPGTAVCKGAWFSKITLDLIFCHAPDANGIFVYEGMMPGSTKDRVYIVEAARTNKILVTDDGSSYIYYSRSMCPTICGKCGM